MKQDPAIQRIVARMRPGVLCKEGFLGTDSRRLEEIIETDRSTLVGLGTDAATVADALQAVYDQAKAALGTPVTVSETQRAVWREAMGRIPCPWGRCGTFPKGEVELTDALSGQSFVITPLSIHQVREHGFFQGRGSRYRLEPDLIVAALGIEGQAEG